jgi:RNA polymerase sigma-70 factor
MSHVGVPVDWSPAELGQAIRIAKTSWPALDLIPSDFMDFLGRSPSPDRRISDEAVADLYLACACFKNVPGALQSFQRRYSSLVAQAVKRFNRSLGFADEVFQRLCETLFVGRTGVEPKSLRYRGKGTLAGFVYTSARRVALRMTAAASRRAESEDALVDQFSQAYEMEAMLLKREHQATFNRALAAALRSLPPRERLVLRLNLIERVSTSQIATMYKVSQPTVSRWIQRAARSIFVAVKESICDELDSPLSRKLRHFKRGKTWSHTRSPKHISRSRGRSPHSREGSHSRSISQDKRASKPETTTPRRLRRSTPGSRVRWREGSAYAGAVDLKHFARRTRERQPSSTSLAATVSPSPRPRIPWDIRNPVLTTNVRHGDHETRP